MLLVRLSVGSWQAKVAAMAGEIVAESAHPEAAQAAPVQEPAPQADPPQQAAVVAHPAAQGPTRKLFSFGAIADVQYANIPDGYNWNETRRRYYRGGLIQLRKAVDVWLQDESHSFALQLGDCIDGRNRPDGSEAALKDVTQELDRLADALPLGVLSSLGNHELYNFSKERWAREVDCSSRAKAATLRPPAGFSPSRPGERPSFFSSSASGLEGMATAGSVRPEGISHVNGDTGGASDLREEERFYFSFCPDATYRFIALHTFDFNAVRERELSPEEEDSVEAAEVYLSERNPNADKNNSTGIEGLSRRFVKYNGGVGMKQLGWLEKELAAASRAGQRVVMFGHLPIQPAASESKCLLWNYDEVLAVLHKYDCVAMYISGHTHQEGYHCDAKGIHHVVMPAALETPAEQGAFSSIDVYLDKLDLRGHGAVQSRTLHLPGRVGELLVG